MTLVQGDRRLISQPALTLNLSCKPLPSVEAAVFTTGPALRDRHNTNQKPRCQRSERRRDCSETTAAYA